MFTEAQCPVPWDLADKKTQKTRFTADSFYLVVDGFKSESVHHACTILKTYLRSCEGVRVRGPKAMPTERRRYLSMPEVLTSDGRKGVKLKKALRPVCLARYQSELWLYRWTHERFTPLRGDSEGQAIRKPIRSQG